MTLRIVAGARDLFGQDVLQRRARFVDGCRITLTRRWGPGPNACVIGHNPSTAGADRDDRTSSWWIDWFAQFGFGGYVAVNLYPWCTPDPTEVYRRVERINGGIAWGDRDMLHFVNLPAVADAAKAADQVFVCWGGIARDDLWIEHVVEEIRTGAEPWPDLWCWGKTASGAPKHPAARGIHRIQKDQKPIRWRPRT